MDWDNRETDSVIALGNLDPVPHSVDFVDPLNRFFRSGETVVVAVSGGPDSMALLHGLVESNQRQSFALRLHVAHLNHQLRGEESDEDAAFVACAAAGLHLPATIESRDVSAVARTEGFSLETAGREERYAFLHRVCLRTGAKVVALGHHEDDNIETILHRIVRGTGIHGLSGISQTRPLLKESNIRLVRPLLRVNRRAILSYLETKGIPFRMDASNAAREPTRNRLRHDIRPLLESLNPRVGDALLRLARQAQWIAEHLDDMVTQSFDALVLQRGPRDLVLDAAALRRRSRILQSEILRRAYRCFPVGERDLTFDHLNECLDLLNADTGAKRINLPNGMIVEKRYHRLSFALRSKPREPIDTAEVVVGLDGTTCIADWDWEITCRITNTTSEDVTNLERNRPFDPFEPCHAESIDADTVQPPLVARHRRPGDRFTPLGAPGTKSIADFFIDAKVDRTDRDRLIVLCDLHGPVWIVGLRLDDRVKITAATRRVLHVSARYMEQK